MSGTELTDEDQRDAIITTITLDISNKHLKEVPKTIKNFSNIEFLYLSTNDIKSIPDHFFVSLPQLKWLDFRHNLLTYLPASIGQHRELRTLLLQGNEITRLPIELGNVPTITGLNMADNPIDYPPKTVQQQGTQEILKYLRLELQRESLLIPELVEQLENVHVSDVTEKEGYLGRKINGTNNSNTTPHSPTHQPAVREPSYYAAERHPTPVPRLSSPTRLQQRSRSQADIVRRRTAARSPDYPARSPDYPARGPDHPASCPPPDRIDPLIRSNTQGSIPRRPDTSGRLFEFVPMMKPKRSSNRICNNLNIRGRGNELYVQSQQLVVEPHSKSTDNTLMTSRTPSREVNRTIPPNYHNAWPESLIVRRSM